MTDESILALYLCRDENAVKETDLKYGKYLTAVSMNILGCLDDASECVNDAYLRAWRAIPPAEPSDLRMYLAKTVRNLSFDRLRQSRAKKRSGGEIELILSELTECFDTRQNPEADVMAKELDESVNRFAATLSKKERGIFIRRYFFAEPVSDIARRYGISPNSAAVILSRTRRKLREHLKKEGYFDE